MVARYSKKGKGHPWTVRELESIPAEWHGDTVSDGGGLSGEVRAQSGTVTVRFRYAFKWEGKVRWYQCGTFPLKPISEIRAERDRARALLADGINPTESRQAARLEAQAAIEATLAKAESERQEKLTVQELFDVWIANGVARKDGNSELRRSFEKDVLPMIGQTEIKELSEADLLKVLRTVKNRGVKSQVQRNMNRTLEVLYRDIGQMLRWAEKRQPWRLLMAESGNPVDLVDISRLLDADYQDERDRVLSPEELRELWDCFRQLEVDYADLPAGKKYTGIRPVNQRVQCAVWICLSTLCRIGELLMSRWEHVDLRAGTWFIPAANTKGHRGKKQDHYISLSNFAIQQFKRLHAETGHTEFCFPSRDEQTHVCVKSVSKLIGDRQARFKNRAKPLAGRHHNDTLVLSGGKQGEWTPHDLRRTGATMMQELEVSLDVIDRCQNHVLAGSRVRRPYLRHEYQAEKAAAWDLLGSELEKILLA